MLSNDEIEFYRDAGYLRIPAVFTSSEMDELERELDFMMEQWAVTEIGWTGPWRKEYMDEETEKRSRLTSLHDLHFYSEAWMRAVAKPELVESIAELIGSPNIELHHTTLHAKPPESGHPFPMHQDNAFYEHADNRYLDVLVHLDDTCHANGEIRFLRGSHKPGALPHITVTPEGEPCTPHLNTRAYRLVDTEPVPAKRGDVVCFNIFTVHGSYINTTNKVRRLVRGGYRDPLNRQLSGQSIGRPNIMVKGRRPRVSEIAPLTNEAVV
ncbi:MAG: phytanoyl-CoA dioxygenase family protein [Candidatus Hydrogenedentes bacterium]|nr:phytanoyl-CoA dioxygenase family protein [Candidatus Hydrogenedentota bacterium]